MRALYVGYTHGTENHGDEALIWILRDLLAPEIEVVTKAEGFDIALLGGGTLINQSPWLIDHFETQLSRAGRGVVFGTGVGDLTFWGDHFDRWVPLLQRCEAVGVRGPDSLSLLQEHGFKDAVMTGDPYLWLHPPVRRRPIPHRLGVNLGSTNNSLWGTNDQDLCDYVSEALQQLKAQGWTFSFLSVWSRDLPLLNEVRGRLGAAAVAPVLDARSHPLETYSMLAGCEVFLGEKLHANAMAAVAGVPFVALEYQPKVRDFSASLSMEPWTLSTAERDPRRLVDLIEDLSSRNSEVRRSLATAHAGLRMTIERFAESIKLRLLAPETIS